MQRVAAALHLEMKFPRKHFPLPSADCRLCSEAGPAQLHVFFFKVLCLGSKCYLCYEWNCEGES